MAFSISVAALATIVCNNCDNDPPWIVGGIVPIEIQS
jgi:hypothetical protein